MGNFIPHLKERIKNILEEFNVTIINKDLSKAKKEVNFKPNKGKAYIRNQTDMLYYCLISHTGCLGSFEILIKDNNKNHGHNNKNHGHNNKNHGQNVKVKLVNYCT